MEKVFKTIIEDAIKLFASDIHFIPMKDNLVLTQFRMNGCNESYDMKLDYDLYQRLLIYMKFISHLDVSERKQAQSGRFIYEHIETYYLRISTMPLNLGMESCAIRLTPQYFNEITNDNDKDFNYLKEAIQTFEGLILFTGPTGSGKTTIMYQLLNYLNQSFQKHIITIEDPVERILNGVVQISVNNRANITYKSSFKAILRCDPDVIMIGEIRDEETARQVIQASLSGHLIFSTLHAKDTYGAIHRLLELGITKEQIKQGINCITNQRLIVSEGKKRNRLMTILSQKEIEKYMESRHVK